jgi:diguanylate cyclase (GGDEF)-like protein/PAS domain S-box-containing protein
MRKSMTIRSRIFLTYTLFLLIPLLAAGAIGGSLIAKMAQRSVAQQVKDEVASLHRLTATVAQTALTQGLQTAVDNSLRMLESLHQKSRSGALTVDEAQWLALDTLATQRIGQQGQVICIDDRGLILAHPHKALLRSPLPHDLFKQVQGLPSQGQVIYATSNQHRLALIKAVFPLWNWTLVAQYPVDEPGPLLPLADIAAEIGAIQGEHGSRPFFLDRSGTFWPTAPTPSVSTAVPEGFTPKDLAETILRTKSGQLTWPPTAAAAESQQVLAFQELPEYGLIAGVAFPATRLAGPLVTVGRALLLLLLPLALGSLGVAFYLAHRLTSPLRRLANDLATIDHDQPAALPSGASSEELVHIATQCSRLLSTFHEHRQLLTTEQEVNEQIQRQLRQEITSRQETEQKLLAENATRRSAENYLQLFKNIFDSAIEGIYITDPQGRILTVNQSFTKITGYQPAEVIGHHPNMLASGPQGKELYQRMWHDLQAAGSWSGEIWNQKKDGSICPQWLSISVIRDAQQQLTHCFAFFHDITELKRREKQISIMAYSDALTKLPNRAALERRLTKAIARAARDHLTLAVFFIDLDNFKNINDSLGHDKGDQVLIEVAARLSKTIRSEDTLSRLGGDEFILLSESIDNENAVYTLATRILAALKQPIQLAPHTIYINASIGIAIYPEDGQTTQELIKNADMAMYKAKSEGKNKFVLFTQEMHEKLLNRIRTENAIRTGLKQREFSVFYQPKIDLDNERITSFEALARWRKNGTIIGPDTFIPIAEESGLIDEMSLYVLDEVCIFLGKMHNHNLPMLPISVNMSPRTFNNVQIVETIDSILGAHRIDHRLIEFEITETTAMKNVQHTLAIMQRFRQRGIRFSIDDFGTGYSSLSYLSEMPVSTLKIDKRFISADDPNSRSIVSTITAMSKQMQLKVVAEGVETSNQLQWLRQIGCNEVQGFYYSRPMPEEDALRYLQIFADLPSKDASFTHSVAIH